MTGGLVATLDGSTTSTNKLQTRQTLSTNYTEHIRLPYFVSEHTMHRWTPTYIASRKNTQQSVSTAPTVMRPLNISCCTVHYTTTSDPDYCQLNQRYTTRYMDPLHICIIISSSLGSRCVPWLGEGLSMSSPNDPVLCCPLPYRMQRVSKPNRTGIANLE